MNEVTNDVNQLINLDNLIDCIDESLTTLLIASFLTPSPISMFRPGLRSPRANASCNWKTSRANNHWLCWHVNSTFEGNLNLPLHRSQSH